MSTVTRPSLQYFDRTFPPIDQFRIPTSLAEMSSPDPSPPPTPYPHKSGRTKTWHQAKSPTNWRDAPRAAGRLTTTRGRRGSRGAGPWAPKRRHPRAEDAMRQLLSPHIPRQRGAPPQCPWREGRPGAPLPPRIRAWLIGTNWQDQKETAYVNRLINLFS